MEPLSVAAWYLPKAVIGPQNLRLAVHKTCLCALHRRSRRGEALPEGQSGQRPQHKSKCKARTNETPEFLTYYVAQQQRPILYNWKVVVLPRFHYSFCSKSRVNLGYRHSSNKD
jgi:hypothetical protein